MAAEIGDDEALVVGPTGGRARPWHVGVGWDGDGAFLGRGWPEFAAVCGVERGWLMVLRHLSRGVLTLIPSRHSTMNAASGGWSLARNHLQAQCHPWQHRRDQPGA
jgi:hypothetical protein